MLPHFKPNDRIVASNIPYLLRKPKIGDVVLFRYNNKILVKRIVRIENKKYYLAGDNKSDNLKTQPIDRKQILSKAIFVLAY
jgi:signal peptidase I